MLCLRAPRSPRGRRPLSGPRGAVRTRVGASETLERTGGLWRADAAQAALQVSRAAPEHVFELANDAYYQLVGHRDVVGRTVAAAIPAPQRRRLLAGRVLASLAVALLAACEGDAPAPTAPAPPATAGSRAAAGPDAAASAGTQSGDRLSRWLPPTPGACLVARRTPDGRYPSRSITLPLPAGLAPDAGRTARFAYRGWAPGLPEPAVLAVCTIPDTPGAREYFATRFGSRAMTPAELRGFAKFVGVTRAEDWGLASSPYVRQSAGTRDRRRGL